MKLPGLTALNAFVHKHLLKLGITLLVVVVLVLFYNGWRYYQYRQSSEFAFVQLQASLKPPKPAELALRVDFNAVTGKLAEAVARAYPFLKSGPDQVRILKETIQTALLKKMLTKEEPPKAPPADEDPRIALLKELTVLPADFMLQFSAGLALRPGKADDALVGTLIEHPVLGQKFRILLRMVKTADGWIINDLVNAEDLVKQFRSAQLARMNARRDILLKKVENTRTRMNNLLSLQSCTAQAGLISDKKTILLVAHVLARHTGNVRVNNVNLEIVFSDQNGKELLRRYFNMVHPVGPGEDFNRNVTVELDGQSDLGRAVLAAKKIVCTTRWQTMGLNNGEVLHMTVVPDLIEDFQ